MRELWKRRQGTGVPGPAAPRRGRGFSHLLPMLISFLVIVTPAPGQQTILHTDPMTQVGTIQFRFTASRSFTEKELLTSLALTQRGSLVWLREFFAFLPAVEPIGVHPFDPMELQRDVVRLRRFYQSAGFLRPWITYELALDEESNIIDVTFIVDEGPPILLKSIDQAGMEDAAAPGLPEGLASEWQEDLPSIVPEIGSRLNLYTLPRVAAAGAAWWRDHGYPFGELKTSYAVDSIARSYTLSLRLQPGPRSTIGAITLSGEKSVRPGVVLRELPFSRGDLYSSGEMVEGRREILSLGLFRHAVVTIPQGTVPADTVPIAVEVVEGPLRLVSGSGGYDSRGGLTAQAEWLHRNFTGDARTFSVSALAQTGVWATEQTPEILYRGAISLTQPYVAHRRLSLVLGTSLEYRDDYRDRSTALAVTSNLIYQVDPLRSVTVGYQVSDRAIHDAHFGEYTSGSIDILMLLSNIAKGDRVLKSSLVAQGSYGSLDDISVPRKGYLLRPAGEVTIIPSLNSVEYLRFDLPLFAFYPVSERFGFAARGSIGSVIPFGKGLPEGDESASVKFLQMRDVLFTAGGPEDARGWGSHLLGPKFPNLKVTSLSPDTTLGVDGYIPVGGLSRVSFSCEFRMPFPGLGRSAGLAAYIDGARVWSPQPEFSSIEAWEDENKFFYSAGVGFLYRLPVGTMRLDLGYKLNPSFQDLREATEIVKALSEGTPVEEIPANNSKRYHGHFSISVTF